MATQDATYLNQVGFAPEIAPYGQNLLGMAAATIYDYQLEYEKNADGTPKLDEAGKPVPKLDASGNPIPVLDAGGKPIISGLKETPQYLGDRQAAFTDLQKDAFTAAEKLGQNTSSKTAATGLEGLATKMQDLKYTPTTATNQYTAPSNLGYTAQEARAGKITQPTDVVGQQVNANEIKTAQMGPAERVSAKSFAQPGAADAYMSPYIQGVIEKQQREAQRAADIAGTKRGAQAASAGAFGGSRQAIENAEAARNLQTQMGDIQATGLQNAYQQAQAQFNAEQNAGLTAQQANQQAGLTVGTQNLTAAQQKAVQDAANALQARGMTASQAMQAALANQSTALTTGTQNAQMEQQANLANANATNAAAQFGAAGTNTANLANAAAGNQMAQYNAGLTQQTGIANLGAEQQANLANANATNAAAQFGAGQGLTSAQTAAQYGQSAAQLGEQSKQYGAGQGLAALQGAAQTNAALGAQAQNLYNQDVNNLGIQNTLGTQQQQGVQNLLTQKYTDFQNEVNAPYKQLGFMSDVVRGAPTSVQGTTVTTPAPSILNQVAGAGTALFGLGKARGGAIKQKKINGLPALLINSMARG